MVALKSIRVGRMSPCGLRGLLVAAMAVLNITAIALSGLGLSELRSSATKNAETRTQNFALAVDQSVGNEINKIDLMLRSVVAGLSGENHQALARINQNQTIREMFKTHRALILETEGWNIADAEGRVIFVANSLVSPGDSVSGRDYFNELKSGRSDELVVSKPLVSQRTGNLVLVLARAIRNIHNEFLGVVIAPLPVSSIEKLLVEFDVGAYGYLVLRYADLSFIARPRHGNSLIGDVSGTPIGDKKVSSELREFVQSGAEKGTYRGVRPYDGRPHVASFRALSNAPLVAIASIAESQFLAEWNYTAQKFIAFVVLFLLIGNGAGVLLFRLLKNQQRDAQLLRESHARLETSLRELGERDSALLSAQEAGELGTFTLDLVLGDWHVSDMLRSIFGLPREKRLSLGDWWNRVHDDDRESLRKYLQDNASAKCDVFDREYRVTRFGNGKTLWIHTLAKLKLDKDGAAVLLKGTIQDVSRRKYAEEALWLANEVFEHTSEGIIVLNRDFRIVATNPAFSAITGYSACEMRGKSPNVLNSGAQDEEFYSRRQKILAECGCWAGETVNRRKNGSLYVQYSRVSAIRDARGEISHFCSVISDISELKESQRRLEHMAYHDELTGLTNRKILTDRMQQAIAQCRRREGEILGVCYIDLDGFKAINDQWGHDVGDALLREIAERLKCCVRSGDTVARLGGDEFVVLFCNLRREGELDIAVSRLMEVVSESYNLAGVAVEVTMSVGVVAFPSDETEEPDVLLRHADQAMYEAKRAGRNRVQYFDPNSERVATERHRLCSQLTDALKRDELRLYYQPKVDLRSGAVVGVEALIRWQHPRLGLLLPGQFLPAMETTELVQPIGEWVLHEALRQRQRWRAAGVDLPVSVNVFPRHLQRPDFVEKLRGILDAYPDLDPSDLELEILETTDMDDIEAISARLDECMRLGVRFSLDDFGTGYSSLTYLRQLPASTVKIDRSFVQDILDDVDDELLVSGIVGLVQTLGKKAVAEGVESIEHGIPLLHSGCDYAQGYGISVPIPADEVCRWLHSWKPPDLWMNAAAPEILNLRPRELAA